MLLILNQDEQKKKIKNVRQGKEDERSSKLTLIRWEKERWEVFVFNEIKFVRRRHFILDLNEDDLYKYDCRRTIWTLVQLQNLPNRAYVVARCERGVIGDNSLKASDAFFEPVV